MRPIEFVTWINTCSVCNSKLYGREYKDKIVFVCKKCKIKTILRKEII